MKASIARPTRAVARLVLPIVPSGVRTRVLRARPLSPLRRWFLDGNVAWWDRWYARTDVDEIAGDPREQRKFHLTLQAVGDGPFGRVLEIGCGPGIFSRMLAPRCTEFIGMDLAPVAVAQANERLADLPHARAEHGSLPYELPGGPFDLIVCSDMLYYLSDVELGLSIRNIRMQLGRDGLFVAVHYRHDIGLPLTGDAVHARLRAAPDLRLDRDLGDETFAIDRFYPR